MSLEDDAAEVGRLLGRAEGVLPRSLHADREGRGPHRSHAPPRTRARRASSSSSGQKTASENEATPKTRGARLRSTGPVAQSRPRSIRTVTSGIRSLDRVREHPLPVPADGVRLEEDLAVPDEPDGLGHRRTTRSYLLGYLVEGVGEVFDAPPGEAVGREFPGGRGPRELADDPALREFIREEVPALVGLRHRVNDPVVSTLERACLRGYRRCRPTPQSRGDGR